MSRNSLAAAVRIEGALFSRDFLTRLGSPNSDLPHLTPQSYGLPPETKVREAISASWNTLRARWDRLQTELQKLPQGDHAVALTRREWLLPVLQELGFGRVQPAAPVRVAAGDESKEYAISHGWPRTCLHLLGAGVPLDIRTPGVPGAAQMAPHALVQECLNRSIEHLWAVLSNGLKWRLLRDSAAIARRSYVEFDLEAIFDGDNTADFALFWLLCHASRFEWRTDTTPSIEPPDDLTSPTPAPPLLQAWLEDTKDKGDRAREEMRKGVEKAIVTLASGFVSHPLNKVLRDQLRSGELPQLEFYKLSLRLVYRLLFVLVAEAKGALLLEDAGVEARCRYEEYYSLGRLRTRASRSRGTNHGDGWQALRLTSGFFREGEPGLAIPALGGILFEETALDKAELANDELFGAMRALCFFEERGARRQVNFDLGSEELGSVYESLLELSPRLDLDAHRFALETLAGNERKTTGSHYTAEILVKSLLDTALDPVLDGAALGGETAILQLRVCDWSGGSGHFLTAAARRIAERLALLRTGGDEPSPQERRRALREVIGHCIYGVDLNPMAVELCKIALWMEGLEPGKPLSFLDAHIRCGNSLLGSTPELLEAGIPDEAFTPLEGDDKKLCARLRRENKTHHKGQTSLALDGEWSLDLGDLRGTIQKLEAIDDRDIAGVRAKENMLGELETSGAYLFTHQLADAWCAAFVWKNLADTEPDYLPPITEEVFRKLRQSPHAASAPVREEIKRLSHQYKWFHPHIEFAEVFAGGQGGFDVNLGNPPWERVKLQEKEWFAARNPEIANAPNAAARGRLMETLKTKDPALHRAFLHDKRRAEGESHFARASGRYPLCGRGDVNTYALFAELNRNLINDSGRAGIIVPSGIATDDTTKFFFQSLSETNSLASLFDFENREAIFSDVHRSYKFCLLTMSGRSAQATQASLVFFATRAEHLDDPARRFALSSEDIALLNPNTKTCPIFRSARDADLTKAIYRRVPVLWREGESDGNPWGVTFLRMFDMSNDSGLFESEPGEGRLPLYEAKMVAHYDHRNSGIVISKTATIRQGQPEDLTEEQHADANCLPMPRYWVDRVEVDARIPDGFQRNWYMGFANVTSATNHRTMVATMLPKVGVGHSMPLVLFSDGLPAQLAACFFACFCSFGFDYVGRQKLGGVNYTYFILKQLPVLLPNIYDHIMPWSHGEVLLTWIARRVLELTYTAHDLGGWATDLGYTGDPFRWDVERRFQLRCELDAAFFHLYGITRGEAAYILDTFPIVRRKDEAHFGCYRTKDAILQMYDMMAI